MREFDYTKLKYSHWDSEILGLVAQIHEYKGRQELYLKQKPQALDRLVELAKIQSTEASNKIEGIVTTSRRIRELVEQKTTPQNRDEEEIIGYRDVLNTIHTNYEYIPVRGNLILQLHRDLYQYSEKDFGGRYKNTQNVIAENHSDGTREILFAPLEPYETPEAINSICESFNLVVDSQDVDPLVLIPIFINDFLCIHPFNDGNGRMSRLLTALLLYRQGYVVGKYISLEKIIEKTKENYYEALRVSGYGWHDGENDSTPFVKYILGIILSAYREFEDRVDLYDEKLPIIEMVRRASGNKIGKFTKSDMMELVPTASRASIENSLKILVEKGVLERHGQGKATFYTKL